MIPINIPQVEKPDMPGFRAMRNKDHFIKWLSQPTNRFMEDV